MSARTREEEYLRRMKALGYEPDLRGMDDEDIEWELSKMEKNDRRRETEWQQPLQTVYRPVDPGLKARILRMFGQPHDESMIPEGQKFYLNGWDNGEDEPLKTKHAPDLFAPSRGGTRRPEESLNYWDAALKGSGEGNIFEPYLKPLTTVPEQDGAVHPTRDTMYTQYSYEPSGHDVGVHMKGVDGGAVPGSMAQAEKTNSYAMTPSEKLIGFIANYEGDEGRHRPKPYKVGGRGNWTIGFGHEIKPGEDFSNGLSVEDAWKVLREDVKEHADAVNYWAAANNVKLTQQQFDALVSLRFNMGSLDGAPKLSGLIISGNATEEQIRKEMDDIINDEKGPLAGLWRRRRDEGDMFFNNDYRRKYPKPPKELFPNLQE